MYLLNITKMSLVSVSILFTNLAMAVQSSDNINSCFSGASEVVITEDTYLTKDCSITLDKLTLKAKLYTQGRYLNLVTHELAFEYGGELSLIHI